MSAPAFSDFSDNLKRRLFSPFLRKDKPGRPKDRPDTPGKDVVVVYDFLATSQGLALTRAFTRITEPKLRRSIVNMVEQIASREAPDRR